MKRFGLLCLLMTALFYPALADNGDGAILSCLREAYPNAAPREIARWGNTAAAVFEDGDDKVLCVLECNNDRWSLVVNNKKALLAEEALPTLLLDTDETLFLTYDTWPHTVFHAFRGQDGLWVFCDETISDFGNDSFVIQTCLTFENTNGGQLRYVRAHYDNNGNRQSEEIVIIIPAMWLSSAMELNAFDINRFPALVVEEYDGQWPNHAFIREAAAYLMPEYTFVGGSLAYGNLQFLMDKPGGTRVFVGCVYDNIPHLTQSSPLPKGTIYGVENFTTSLGLGGRKLVTLDDYPNYSGWGVIYSDYGEFRLGSNGAMSYADNTLYFGAHPWNDITAIDWDTLPDTVQEAAKNLDAGGWALVTNPNPADRLHLRVSPDRGSASMGKYYSGTPVYILKQKGDWTQVKVFGRTGWMMNKYLDFTQPFVIDLSIMPHPEIKNKTAGLYAAPGDTTALRTLSGTYGMAVIGILGGDWYHVWFPISDESGYVRQSDLLEQQGS